MEVKNRFHVETACFQKNHKGEFICGDVSKLVDDNVDGNKIIVDPPRTGLDNHTIDVLNNVTPSNVTLYGKVCPVCAKKIIAEHVEQGKVVSDLVISSCGE